MIKSHKDYLEYLEADRISLGLTKSWRTLLFDDVWRFQRLMRKLEYLTNCKKIYFLEHFILICTDDKGEV